MLEKGKILQGRYRIEAVMERRKKVVLYRAYDETLLQNVILKEYFPEKIKSRKMLTDEEKELFVKETEKFFGRFEWNGIIQIKDRFEENETVYLVLEYISKRTVKEYLREGSPQKKFDWKTAVQMLLPVIKMMSFLHAEGMVFGKVSMEDLWVREDGTCCLISVGENPVSKEDAEELGPWSDIYEACGILLEMLKGRETDEQIRQMIRQGRNAEIQQRYFYFGILLERLAKAENAVERSELEEIRKLREKTQEVWGEKWLEITTSSEKTNERKKRKKLRMTKTRIRKLKVTAAVLFCVLSAFGGFSIWKERQPKTRQEILDALEQTGTAKKYDNSTYYTVSKELAEEYRLTSNYENAFAVKREELLNWIQDHYGIERPKTSSAEWSGTVLVYEDASREMRIENYETITYAYSVRGNQLKLSVKYDVTDDSVYSVVFDSGKEICEDLVLEFLPVIVPETYLTEVETEDFFIRAEEADYGYTYSKHAKYRLYLEQTTRDNWNVEFYNYPRSEQSDTEMVRAGNYDRNSEKYQEFTEFLQNRSVSVEEVGNGTLCTLDEAAVEEWGEACNAYLLDISADEVRAALTGKYGAELAKEDTMLEATVYEGGAVETFFVKREKYYCEDMVRILLVSDYISGKVNRLYVFDEENNEERAAYYMREALSLISNDPNAEDAENSLKEGLREYQEKVAEEESYSRYAVLEDCGYTYLQVDALTGICIQRMVREGIDCAPYDWP